MRAEGHRPALNQQCPSPQPIGFVLATCALLLAASCRPAGSAPATSQPAPPKSLSALQPPPDALDDPAAPLDQRLQAAAARMQRLRAYTGWPAAAAAAEPCRNLPDAAACNAGPQFPVIRLDQLLPFAKVESGWKAATASAAPLAVLPAASLNQPASTTRVVETRNARGVTRWIEWTGPNVSREQIGQIALRATITGATEFAIAWEERAASIPVPVRAGGGVQEYLISTDGLTRWSGLLSMLRVGIRITEGAAAATAPTLAVESIELRPPVAAFPLPADSVRASRAKRLRTAVYVHAPGSLRYSGLSWPMGARFSGAAAAIGGAVQLRIGVRNNEQRLVWIEHRIEATDDWTELAAGIPAPGQNAEVYVEAASDCDAVLLLAEPTIYMPHPAPPRVILYLIDTLAASHMSLYGYPRDTTPRLAALAREGAWVRDMFANGSRTIESVPSLMLSLPTLMHQIRGEHDRPPDHARTLAECFADAGYATASLSTNVNAGPRQAMDQGFGTFFDRISLADDDNPRTIPLEETWRWLEQHRDRPVFLYVHTAEPHEPYSPPEPFRGRFARSAAPADSAHARDPARLAALYDGEIAFADDMLGRFVDGLTARGLTAGLTLAVTADHGEEFMQHGGMRHGQSVFAELVRIPLIFWAPGRIAVRGELPTAAQLLDVMPTLLDLAGLPPPPGATGASLRPLLDGAPAPRLQQRTIMSEAYLPRAPHRAVMEGRWKLVHIPARREQSGFLLFDMQADPGETRDVLSANSEVALRLARTLANYCMKLPRYRSDAPPAPMTQDDARTLREMGYIENEDHPAR